MHYKIDGVKHEKRLEREDFKEKESMRDKIEQFMILTGKEKFEGKQTSCEAWM